MKKRCYNPKSYRFDRYGGRGITVCDRWKESFENFLEDMGEPPAGMSLDRIDNDASYSPENCRWVDMKTQARNKRSNRIVKINGTEMTLADAADKSGIPYETFRARLRIGWSVERALTEPVRRAAL